MANSTTNLDLVTVGQAAKEVTVNALLDAASPATLFGRRAAGCVALTWAWYGGVVMSGGTPTRLTNGSISLPASSTLYLEATPAGVVSTNTVGWTSGQTPLYKIVTSASAVTSYEDWRCMALAIKP